MKTIVRRLIVGYIRSAIKDDLSVKKQEKQIIKYCRKNLQEVDKIFVDNGCSGANLNRPALKKLLAKASKGDIFRVICLDRSRLSRNTTNYFALMSLFKKYEVEVIFLTGMDASSKLMEEIFAQVNAWQSQIRRNRRKLKKLGK